MAKETFNGQEIKAFRPALAPERKEDNNFLLCEQVPYLQELVIRARRGGYSQEEACEAWSKLLNNKSKEIDFEGKDDDLDLAEALTVLFQHLSYYETKWHYCAFLEFAARPERYAD